MSRWKKILAIVAGGVVVLSIAGFAAWWFLLRSDAPPPVNLDDAVAGVTTTATASSGTSATDSSTTVPAGLTGTWTITDGSFAGYRVDEELANVGFTTAAGRSDQIVGDLEIVDDSVTAVSVTVDVTALESDSDRRDQAIESQALETRDFPEARFGLLEPITLPAEASAGAAFAIDGFGHLTIHGVTRQVTITLEARFVDDLIVVVGSTPILFADYAIALPRALVLLSVEDNGILEFQLVFARG